LWARGSETWDRASRRVMPSLYPKNPRTRNCISVKSAEEVEGGGDKAQSV